MKTIKKINNNVNNAIGLSNIELTQRFGSANAEFLKGLRGIDNETGKKLDRSLRDVASYKINPDYVDNNVKQQAGYSAEIAKTARDNSENIINKNPIRVARSEDVPGYGKNHTVVDLVELLDGEIVAGSTSQVKFVSNCEQLLENIAQGEGRKKDFSRYLEVDKIDLPTEQVEQAKKFCQQKSSSLRQQASRLESEGKPELASKLRRQADNYDKLEGKIRDSGLTTEEAIQYRLNPEKMTLKDIHRVSHRAGLEGAKFGAAIGGSISLITNIFAVTTGEKKFEKAAADVAIDTGKSAGVGYMTAYSGSAIKGYMQQSTSQYARALSKTALPALVISVCLACTKSIYSYSNGDISEKVLMQELGATANGMLGSSMFATLGQVAIPIPVLGGLVGGMIGYTISNIFYHGFLQSLDDAKASREHLEITKQKCRKSIELANAYQRRLIDILNEKIFEFSESKDSLFRALNDADIKPDVFCQEINLFATKIGKKLQFNNQNEFDHFMASDAPLKL